MSDVASTRITWYRCTSYDDAKDYTRVVYLHEWDEKPFYWGMVKNSYFGGNKRTRGDDQVSGRYANGYRHWIEGCLRHGARLYIGVLEPSLISRIEEIEAHLIESFPSVMNSRKRAISGPFDILHSGDVPHCLRPAA